MPVRVTTDVDLALEVLRGGGLVAIPTETVYGLAADASNEAAVRRVFAAKGRPVDHPLIVHVADAEQLPAWAAHVPAAAAVLADACWPGPLTVIVPKAAHVLDVVTGGRPSVGVRVPAHPLTTERPFSRGRPRGAPRKRISNPHGFENATFRGAWVRWLRVKLGNIPLRRHGDGRMESRAAGV